mmetsp:Transcript_16822/g.21844  ORF Transcript_16822/g.21844 Transcript_16822/m.21844 type:complete len:287 (+) Transcript_16822:51-911(+)
MESTATRPVKVGVLFKRSDYLKEYKPRYFAVEPPQLVYSLPESPTRVHKALDLTMCKISRGTATVTWGQHVLHILIVAKPGAGVSYTLGALTPEEANAWVNVLKKTAGDATRAFVKTLRKDSDSNITANSAPAASALIPPGSRQKSPAERTQSSSRTSSRTSSPRSNINNSPPPQNTITPNSQQLRSTVEEQKSHRPLSSQADEDNKSKPSTALPTSLQLGPPPPDLIRFLVPSLAYALLRIAPPRLAMYRGLVFVLLLVTIIVTTPALQRRRRQEGSSSSVKKLK